MLKKKLQEIQLNQINVRKQVNMWHLVDISTSSSICIINL